MMLRQRSTTRSVRLEQPSSAARRVAPSRCFSTTPMTTTCAPPTSLQTSSSRYGPRLYSLPHSPSRRGVLSPTRPILLSVSLVLPFVPIYLSMFFLSLALSLPPRLNLSLSLSPVVSPPCQLVSEMAATEKTLYVYCSSTGHCECFFRWYASRLLADCGVGAARDLW